MLTYFLELTQCLFKVVKNIVKTFVATDLKIDAVLKLWNCIIDFSMTH